MSMVSYLKAANLIRSNISKSFFTGKREDQLIASAELVLGHKFTGSFRMFLSEFGAGSYGSFEVLGVIDDDFYDSSIPDGVWFTLSERQNGLPNHLFIVYHTGGEEVFCLDFKSIKNEEPKIVTYYPGLEEENQPYEVVYDDFGDMLLDFVTRSLK